ncbi:hypothetical protein HK104_006791 [Borealophlyctis nickersoniae]|nr:hypothetical protein HK104_006791 [Borealophlyctis nickersoniae]
MKDTSRVDGCDDSRAESEDVSEEQTFPRVDGCDGNGAESTEASEEQTPSPIVPYELIRLIAQWSPPATAARVRRLDRTTARVILTADLVLIKALNLCKRGIKYAVRYLGYELKYAVGRPDISEALYTTLVDWGADPEVPSFVVAAIRLAHFNVVRAMVAAGVDVLSLFDKHQYTYYERLTNPESFKFLVEELGYEPTEGRLEDLVLSGQWENAAYLVSQGADPTAIDEYPIEAVIMNDDVKTLEWLMQYRICLEKRDVGAQFLLRQGADPLFIRNGKMLLERAIEKEEWEVAEMMLAHQVGLLGR